MITLGIEAHKRTYAVVAVDDIGCELGTRTATATTTVDHLDLLRWAERIGAERTWAVEDRRYLPRELEADLLAAGEKITRVPPKLIAHIREEGRTYGKPDPNDALAVARASLEHPDLPPAQLDGPTRELRLLVDHRENLVSERTRFINRLRWHLHELDPSWDPTADSLTSYNNIDAVESRLAGMDGMVVFLARQIAAHIRDLTVMERALERMIKQRGVVVPSLLAIVGVGALTAAKIAGEVADIRRFRSKDAFARHNGTAPPPVWASNQRQRLSRSGNRQLHAAIRRIVATQSLRSPEARAYLARRAELGNTREQARRALERRLSDVVYRALLADAHTPPMDCINQTATPLPVGNGSSRGATPRQGNYPASVLVGDAVTPERWSG